jgi:hypothetical protein
VTVENDLGTHSISARTSMLDTSLKNKEDDALRLMIIQNDYEREMMNEERNRNELNH